VTSRAQGWEGWDAYAPFYDWENAQTVARRDVAFWQRLALAQEGPVLELGTGTGRIALPVIRAGVRLVGIDRSEEMLERAKTRLRRARLQHRGLLVRGGLFGVDLVPDLPRWSEYKGRKSFAGKKGRDGRLTLIESVRQDRARRLTIFDHEYIESRGRERRVHRFSLTFRTLSVPQMTRRLEAAGFRVKAVLGDYRGGPWDSRADVWVILAEKK